MTNPTGKKLEKIIFKLFDDASQGVDRYNHNDSLWLIFTNEMRWVVEYTKDQTLWYNYNFFKDEMDLIGLNCVEDKDLIKKWFESRFLDMQKVKDSCEPFFDQDQYVKDTIQNGVKDTLIRKRKKAIKVEDTIQNGVKDTRRTTISQDQYVEDTIQNGVKDIRRTRLINLSANQMVEDTIQNGVRHTLSEKRRCKTHVEDTIQNGVRHTKHILNVSYTYVEDTIQNGVKQTELSKRDFFPKDTIQKGVRITKSTIISQDSNVEDTIKNGVKETIGTLRRTAKWGVDDIIQNGVKETHDDCSNNIARVEGIVRIGEKLN